MVLGEHIFCLCELRHSGPDNNCHGPKGRSGSLTRGPVDCKSNQTRSPDGHSGSLNRGSNGHSGILNCGRSRPREGYCPHSRSPANRKRRQTRSPDCHSGSLNRVTDGHSGSLNCGHSRPREGCCRRSSCHRSCGRSHSESRPSRCRQYQHCQGGKLYLVQKSSIFLTLIILLDRCQFQHCSGSRVPRVQKFIRDLATGTCHPIKMT